MDFIEALPEDLINVLLKTLHNTSRVAIVVLLHVNKFYYKVVNRYAKKHHIYRILDCSQIALEGSLEVLKWAVSNDFYWDLMTCAKAAEHGHFELLKWARENGCEWTDDIEADAKQQWPDECFT